MSLGTGALKVGMGPEHFQPPRITNSKVLEERSYPYTLGEAMGTSGYSQTNPKHYRVTKRSVRTYVSSKGIEACRS